jgi:hypothetical protein
LVTIGTSWGLMIVLSLLFPDAPRPTETNEQATDSGDSL